MSPSAFGMSTSAMLGCSQQLNQTRGGLAAASVIISLFDSNELGCRCELDLCCRAYKVSQNRRNAGGVWSSVVHVQVVMMSAWSGSPSANDAISDWCPSRRKKMREELLLFDISVAHRPPLSSPYPVWVHALYEREHRINTSCTDGHRSRGVIR